MAEGRHVVGNLLHILQGNPRRLVIFEQQQVGKGGLGALDLRGKHGLLPHVGVNEKGEIGQQRCQAVQAAQRLIGLFQNALQGF